MRVPEAGLADDQTDTDVFNANRASELIRSSARGLYSRGSRAYRGLSRWMQQRMTELSEVSDDSTTGADDSEETTNEDGEEDEEEEKNISASEENESNEDVASVWDVEEDEVDLDK